MTQPQQPPAQEASHFLPSRLGTPGYVPNPFAHWTVATPPRPPRWPALVFSVTLLVTVGLVIGALATFAPLPAPPPPKPQGLIPTVASPAPTAYPSTAQQRTLMDHPLYALKPVGTCPRITTPGSRRAYETQVDAVIDCLSQIYRPLIEQTGGSYTHVGLQHYDTSVDTPCGHESGAFAFYCSRNSTIYLSDDVYASAQDGRLSVADTVLHEYSHHVQSMAGFFNAAEALNQSRSAIERRVELQVFCWTYYMFTVVDGFAVTDTDRRFFLWVWDEANDPEGHGSVTAQKYWGARGVHAENLGACNTWSAPAGLVK